MLFFLVCGVQNCDFSDWIFKFKLLQSWLVCVLVCLLCGLYYVCLWFPIGPEDKASIQQQRDQQIKQACRFYPKLSQRKKTKKRQLFIKKSTTSSSLNTFMSICYHHQIPSLLEFGVIPIQAIPGVPLQPSRTTSGNIRGVREKKNEIINGT